MARAGGILRANLAAVALAGSLAGGCVERIIRITSEPPGALVWLNDVEIGRTPVETDFNFYGTYDVRLKRDGYEAIAEGREASAPIYDWPGIDLVAEALPLRFKSRFEWHFDLRPVAVGAGETETEQAGSEAEFLKRARVMRAKTGAESR